MRIYEQVDGTVLVSLGLELDACRVMNIKDCFELGVV